jgi:hypothetical protein
MGKLSFDNVESIEWITLSNIVDMGITFSAMNRLFEKGTKGTLRRKLLDELKRIFRTGSKDDFDRLHSDFCRWGVKNLQLAERRRAGKIIKEKGPASYGQVVSLGTPFSFTVSKSFDS